MCVRVVSAQLHSIFVMAQMHRPTLTQLTFHSDNDSDLSAVFLQFSG